MELSSVLKTNEAKVVVIVFVVVAVVYEIFTLLFTPSADSNNEKPAEEVVQEAKKGARTKKATKAAGDKDAMEEFMNEALPPTKSSNRGRSKSPAPAQVAKKSAKIIPVRLPSPAPVKVVKSGPTPKKASQFEVGDEVVVAHRSEKGSKIKEGGIGRCIAVEAEKGAWTYSVAYSLGGREFGLAEKHLGSSDLLAESPSKRESRPTAKKAAGEEAAAKRSPRSSSRSKRTRK